MCSDGVHWRKSHADGHDWGQMKKTMWIVTILLLLALGGIGLNNSLREWDDATSAWQRTVQVAVALYGVSALAAGVGLAMRRRWSVFATAVAVTAACCAGTVASFAYSDPAFSQEGTLIGVVMAFLSTAVVGALLVWSAHVATRGARVPHSSGTSHIPTP
jgi:peptidoglycan/LPS O-acetylase OafA/YrhL